MEVVGFDFLDKWDGRWLVVEVDNGWFWVFLNVLDGFVEVVGGMRRDRGEDVGGRR